MDKRISKPCYELVVKGEADPGELGIGFYQGIKIRVVSLLGFGII